jgi:hypothetical protein
MVASYKIPRAYNYWALLATEFIFLGVWAYGFVMGLAGRFDIAGNEGMVCFYGWVFDSATDTWSPDCYYPANPSLFHAAGNCSLAVLGSASALMVLWLVSFIVVSVFIARHGGAGGHSRFRTEKPVREEPMSETRV